MAKVLVIDDAELDNRIFQIRLKKLLKDAEITTSTNGKNAIDKLLGMKKSDADLLPEYIFLDLTMPVMNGWDFLNEFTKSGIDPSGKIKIYILSSSVCEHDRKNSLDNSAVMEFISKPIETGKIKKIFGIDHQ